MLRRGAHLIAPLLWSLDPMATKPPAPRRWGLGVPAGDVDPALGVRVMTWNIKFGGGRLDFFFDGHGDRVLMSPREVESHLGQIARFITAWDPDLLLLQEVDVASKRAAGIDQVGWLLGHTPLNCAVYASQWRANHIPKHGLGQVDSGVAILSKVPLQDVRVDPLPLMGDQDGVTQYFYLRRVILSAALRLTGGRSLRVLNTHLSAFAHDDTKRQQLRLLKLAAAQAGERVVAGGDLNALSPWASRRHGFADEAVHKDPRFEGADFRGQQGWLEPLYRGMHPAISPERLRLEEPDHFTHSTRGDAPWNRKLDYLFASTPWTGGGTTHQQGTEAYSDHAPLSAVWGL